MTSPRILVEQIALYLGKPWKFNFQGEPSSWRYEIIDGMGKTLFFTTNKSRFRISGHFPANHTRAYSKHYKSITVSMERSPKDIAGDIFRRLIPDYLKAYAEAQTIYQEEKSRQEHITLIANLIQKASQGRILDQTQSNAKVYFKKGNAQIWRDEKISLALNNLTVEEAIKILSLLQ